MNILAPLGFLGLIGVILILIIYFLKPNYQQKVISSTHIWKLSLKFRKKRIPINRLLNLILLLCQILIITACAFILAQPYVNSNSITKDEKIAIIDASVGMLSKYDGETRFERAISQVRNLTNSVLAQENGKMTVILAGKNASYVVRRSAAVNRAETLEAIDGLLTQCTYGSADIDGAMKLADEILEENPLAEVSLYTGTDYLNKGSVNVVNVAEKGSQEKEGEWNAAILNVTPEISDNFYLFTIDLACYNRNVALTLDFQFHEVNNTPETMSFQYENILCSNDETVTVVVNPSEFNRSVYSYKDVLISIVGVQDSFPYDNEYCLYGGSPETLRIQYTSSVMNNFWSGLLMSLRETVQMRWNIEIKEVRIEESSSATPELSGYDLYIFEQYKPETIPTDGIVLFVNPQSSLEEVGIILDSIEEGEFTLKSGEAHPITAGIDAEGIAATAYGRISLYDNYKPILYCGDDPVMLVRNDAKSKIAVLSVSVNYSYLPVIVQFPYLFYNLFNYYLPSPVTQADGTVSHVYEVDDTVIVNGIGTEVTVDTSSNQSSKYESFPAELEFSFRGTYTFTQSLLSDRNLVESVYVKTAAKESNIFRVENELTKSSVEEPDTVVGQDLLVYLAVALAALLFVEWLLHWKDNF